MTSFFPETGEELKREWYKDPIRSHLRGSRQDNYKLYESTQQKVEETHPKEWIDRRRKLLFPSAFALCPLYQETRRQLMEEAFFRRHPGAFAGRMMERIQLFLCFSHSLKQQTFDHSTMTRVFPHYMVHLDRKKKDEEDRDEDNKESKNEDYTI